MFLEDKFPVAQAPVLTRSCGICENPALPSGCSSQGSRGPFPAARPSRRPCPGCRQLPPAPSASLSKRWCSRSALAFASLLRFPGGFCRALGCRGEGLCSGTASMCLQNSSWVLQVPLRKNKKINASVQPGGKGGKEGLGA